MFTFKRFASLCVTLALSLHGALVSAHSTFPTEMQAELSMPCTPACTICHKDNVGGFGTISEPFGKAMQAQGLLFVPVTLSPALKKLEEAGTDSDGDGVGDIAELREGQDPNGDVDLCSQVAARYGCGARIAPAPPLPEGSTSAPLAGLFTALALGASAHRAARRRRARQGFWSKRNNR